MANPLIETVREALSELSPENPWTFDDALSALARIEALLAETEARAVRAEAVVEAARYQVRHYAGDTTSALVAAIGAYDAGSAVA